jgi:hypothetical protein
MINDISQLEHAMMLGVLLLVIVVQFGKFLACVEQTSTTLASEKSGITGYPVEK